VRDFLVVTDAEVFLASESVVEASRALAGTIDMQTTKKCPECPSPEATASRPETIVVHGVPP